MTNDKNITDINSQRSDEIRNIIEKSKFLNVHYIS